MSERIRFTTSELGDVVVTKTATDSIERARLAHEAEVLRAIEHPNVIRLIDGSHDEISLSYGGPSDLAHAPVASAEELARISASVFSTIADVAELGWAHHAMSPGHCLVGQRGKVSICSWGRARPVRGRADPAVLQDVADAAAMLRLVALELDDDVRAGRRRITALTEMLDELISRPVDPREAVRRIARLADAWAAGRAKAAHRGLGALGARGARGARGSDARPTREAVARQTSHATVGPSRRDPSIRSELIGQFVLLAICAAVLALLLFMGSPRHGPTSLGPSAAGASLITTGVVVLRWLAIVASAYGVVVATVGVIAAATRKEAVAALQRRLAPALARRVLAGVTGLGLVGTVIGAAGSPSGTDVAALVPSPGSVAPATSTPPSSSPDVPAPTPTPTQPPLSVPTAAVDTSPTSTPTEHPAATTTPTTGDNGAPAAREVWVIARGDHLWRVAERTVLARLGRAGSDAEVQRYWRELIATNRGVLADPANPDLVFAGQVFQLPPTDVPPTS